MQKNTLAMSKLMHRQCISTFLVNKLCRWFVVSITEGVLQECGNMSCISDVLIYSLLACFCIGNITARLLSAMILSLLLLW